MLFALVNPIIAITSAKNVLAKVKAAFSMPTFATVAA